MWGVKHFLMLLVLQVEAHNKILKTSILTDPDVK